MLWPMGRLTIWTYKIVETVLPDVVFWVACEKTTPKRPLSRGFPYDFKDIPWRPKCAQILEISPQNVWTRPLETWLRYGQSKIG